MLQVGSIGGQGIALGRFNVSSQALLKGGRLSVMSFEEASDAMMLVEDAISAISNVRSYYGAMQNRLEHVIANLDNSVENTQAAMISAFLRPKRSDTIPKMKEPINIPMEKIVLI